MKKKSTTSFDPVDLRRQAERKLKEIEQKAGFPPKAEADTQRLLHELQVHQIELEMQIEELARSSAEVETLLLQYTDLYDFAPAGYFTLAPDGAIQQANLTGARLLGVPRGNLIKQRFGLFVSVETRKAFKDFLDQVFSNGSEEACEIGLLKDGADPLWAQITGICIEDRQECHAVVTDITERKRVEEQMRYLSTRDALTGLYNRRFFEEEMARLERGRNFPISIMMADVDHLKRTNDQQGHAAGDALLKRIGQVLTAAFRVEDVVARIGGDEFAVLLPGADVAAAEASLRRVRMVIQENNAAYIETPIYLSAGVSTAMNPGPLSGVLHEADVNMYREKRRRYAS